MQPIKAIVFDLGKVLVDFDYGIAGRKLAERATMAGAELGRFLVHVPLIVRYETGLITTQQFYDEVRTASGYLGNLEEFASLFADIFTPIPYIVPAQLLAGWLANVKGLDPDRPRALKKVTRTL